MRSEEQYLHPIGVTFSYSYQYAATEVNSFKQIYFCSGHVPRFQNMVTIFAISSVGKDAKNTILRNYYNMCVGKQVHIQQWDT